MPNNLNLFEVLQILSKNQNLQAVKHTPQGDCFIKWKGKTSFNDFDKYNQLVFINVQGDENENLLTDTMIEWNNQNFWSIIENKEKDYYEWKNND